MDADDVPGLVAVAMICRASGPGEPPEYLLVEDRGGVACFPGGKLKLHEDPVAALLRELAEELGVESVSEITPCTREHASLVDVASGTVVDDKIIHVFKVRASVPAQARGLPRGFYSQAAMAAMKDRLLFDNWLLVTGEPWTVPEGHPFAVPSGFFDSPGEGLAATRRFFWTRTA